MERSDYTSKQYGAGAPPAAEMADGKGVLPGVSPSDVMFDTKRTKLDNNFCCGTPLDVVVPCACCFIVSERQEVVEMFFGRYHGTITQPGCYCRTSLCLELRRVGTELITFDLKNTKVLDAVGSPLMVSGIVTYRIVDSRAAAIDVNDSHQFVRDQAPAVLKRVVSQFPYESSDENVACLRTETAIVSDRMRDVLQQRVQVAGVKIDTFSINELSYAPEIAHAMLRRQQAEALVSARRAIMQGAREIAMDAVGELDGQLSEDRKAALLSNLLLVLVGDKDVVPTLSVAR